MRIYAVDDEPLALELLCAAIKEAAPTAELLPFASPVDAFVAAQQKPCDILFTDIQMPEMLGLDMAKKFSQLNPNVNIIFVTGYSDYAHDALDMFASGYVLKPVRASAVQKQLDNLRHPVRAEKKEISAITFGHFSIYVKDVPIHFHRSKSKEMIAYLVDRAGGSVTRKELAAILFEEGEYTRNQQKYLSLIVQGLEDDLKAVHAEDLLIRSQTSYCINKDVLSCDLYDYLNGDLQTIKNYNGQYMEQYSWGEYFKAVHPVQAK